MSSTLFAAAADLLAGVTKPRRWPSSPGIMARALHLSGADKTSPALELIPKRPGHQHA